MYLIVWEFLIQAQYSAEFEAIYGAAGDWAKLFAQSEGYLQTRLLRDPTDATRYVTLDVWTSRNGHEKFRREHSREYEALDRACERLTVKEIKLGEFEGG